MTLKAVRSLADLYDAWHAAEPDQGYDAQAAQWRAKLPTTSQPASQPASGPATEQTERPDTGDE